MENFAKMKDIADRARDIPNAANQVQYPAEFNNCVPVITAVPLQPAKIDTIIIATQSKGYTEKSFETDVKKTVDFFKLDYGMYLPILLKPVSEELPSPRLGGCCSKTETSGGYDEQTDSLV